MLKNKIANSLHRLDWSTQKYDMMWQTRSCFSLQMLFLRVAQPVHWLQAVQEHVEDVQEQAEDISDSSSPAQAQAAADVQETVNEAAPQEDPGDTLSVLQEAKSAMDKSEASQVNCLHVCCCCCCQSSNVRLQLEAEGCSRMLLQAGLSHRSLLVESIASVKTGEMQHA